MYYLTFSVGWESGNNLAGQFCLSSLVSCPSSSRPRLQSSKGLAGLASWCWGLAGGLSSLSCGLFHRTAWVSSQCGHWPLPERVIWERARHSCNVFYNLISEALCHHFCSSLLVMPIQSGRGASWRLAVTAALTIDPQSILFKQMIHYWEEFFKKPKGMIFMSQYLIFMPCTIVFLNFRN